MNKNAFAVSGLLFLLNPVISFETHARTLYVETWGTNNNVCSKTAPCKDLDHAVSTMAGDRDRIVVGPGNFDIVSGGLQITQSGLKLVSVAGARGTTLVPPGNATVMEINAPKVTVGQKGKGFTFRGNFNNHGAILLSGADKARIEGNIFVDEADNGGNAIESDSAGDTVRGNEIHGFSDAIYLDSGLDGTRYQVRDNRVFNARNTCIGVGSGQKSRNRVSGNVVSGCDLHGFEIYSDTASGDRIENNVVEQSTPSAYTSYGIYVYDGTPLIRRNVVRGMHEFGIAFESDGTANIRDNLVSDTDVGLYVGNGSVDTTVQYNTIVGSATSVVLPVTTDSIRKFFRNNLLDYDCPYDFVSDGPFSTLIESEKTFHDQPLFNTSLIINCSSDDTAEDAIADGFLDVSDYVTRANPVKAKSDL
jgi:hypothetical protein